MDESYLILIFLLCGFAAIGGCLVWAYLIERKIEMKENHERH